MSGDNDPKKTHMHWDTDPPAPRGGDLPRIPEEEVTRMSYGRRGAPDDDAPEAPGAASAPPQDDAKTVLFRGSRGGSPATEQVATSTRHRSSTDDPVVGWLVVVRGPGRGMAREIHHGANVVGRDPSQRVALDFGDPMISREDHARIIYDDRDKKYYIAGGTGQGLTRVNGGLVRGDAELETGALIEFGSNTIVRFIAFCDETFDWTTDLDAATGGASAE